MTKVKFNDITINYTEQGEGEPLILIMGLGADGPVWEQHVATYSKHFRCIMPDNRGVGQSDAPQGPYQTTTMADDIASLMDYLNIEKAHVNGISMGGAIAQQLSIRHPQKVQSQVLTATWSKFDAYTGDVYTMLKKTRRDLSFPDFMELLQLRIFTSTFYNQNRKDLQAGQKQGAEYQFLQTQHGFEGQADACISHDTTAILSHISTPTLITAGTKDIFVPIELSLYLHENIKNSEFLSFEGWGHTHHWEDLEKYNSETITFFKNTQFNR